MRSIIPGLLFLATWTHASTVVLPEIFVTETPSSEGGIYTVTINQPPLEQSNPWYLVPGASPIRKQRRYIPALAAGPGICSAKAPGIRCHLRDLYTGEPIYRFTSGSAGVGDFDSIFGTGFSQAAVFWVDQYYADPGLATSSNFNWVAEPATAPHSAVISSRRPARVCPRRNWRGSGHCE